MSYVLYILPKGPLSQYTDSFTHLLPLLYRNSVGPVRAVDSHATPTVFAAIGGEDGDVVVADAPPDVDEGGDVAVVMARDVEARGAGGSVVGAFTSAGVVGEATSGEDAAARIWDGDCGRDGTAADGAADAGVGGTAGDNN